MNHRGNSGRSRRDRGQMGGMEVLPLGFLLFVSVVLIIVNAWGFVDAKLAVTASAREGVRAYVESDNDATGAVAAVSQASSTLAAYGRNNGSAIVSRPTVDGGFGRCHQVTMTVSYRVPVIKVPFIGGFGNLRSVSSTYSEIIDPFRSGIAGETQC